MRYVLMVDGSFMLYRLGARLGQGAEARLATADDVIAECDAIRSHPEFVEHELLRILFYDAAPFADRVHDLATGEDRSLDTSPTYRRRRALLDQLALAPNIALRLGELSYEGFTLGRAAASAIVRQQRPILATDLSLRLTQKGVDLRIGLDIARLTLRERVDAIVVVTGDSDFIPAFKFARREGVRVYLDHMGGSVKRDLKVHADVVLRRTPQWAEKSGSRRGD